MKFLLPVTVVAAVWLAVIVSVLRLLAHRERHVERADRLADAPHRARATHSTISRGHPTAPLLRDSGRGPMTAAPPYP